MTELLLDVRALRVKIATPTGFATIVDGVDYQVAPQQVFGIAGESGSGKTMSVLALLGLLPHGAVVEGEAWFRGRDLLGLPRKARRAIAGRDIAMVFQDPTTSLHPMLSIGHQLTEHMRHHLGTDKGEAQQRGQELLAEVRIPDPAGAMRRFPHEFSGGMRQRIAIAMALACDPAILVADEPTTALDVTVQAGVLRLLDRLRRERGLSVMLITHDLAVMSSIADSVTIFYAGRVVETGTRPEVLGHARHPYTAGLLAALPHPERRNGTELVAIPGTPPTPQHVPNGCPFHPRCPYATQACEQATPALVAVNGSGHQLACPVDPFRS